MRRPNLDWNWPSSSGEKDFSISESVIYYSHIVFSFTSLGKGYDPSFEKTWVLLRDVLLHFNKLKSPSPKNELRHIWLKLALWFWRISFQIRQCIFTIFIIISPWRRVGPFIWINLNSLHPRMLFVKFGWNWSSGSGEDENVKSLQTDRQMYDRRSQIMLL